MRSSVKRSLSLAISIAMTIFLTARIVHHLSGLKTTILPENYLIRTAVALAGYFFPILGGWIALPAVILLGARRGRYTKEGQVSAHPPSSIPFLALGAWILAVGWFGFNVMSAQTIDKISGLVAMNSLMAMVGGKRKTEIRNATTIEFRDLLISIAESANAIRSTVQAAE